MNDNLDDFLNSLGISQDRIQSITVTTPSGEAVIPATIQQQPEEAESQEMNDSDFTDLLAELGSAEPTFDEAEEVHEEQEVSMEDYDISERLSDAITSVNPDTNSIVASSVSEIPRSRIMVAADEVLQSTEAVRRTRRAIRERAGLEPTVEANTVVESLIPQNSPTLLIDDSTSRFSGAEWYNAIREKRIMIAGLGGIGSWTAFLLGRMSPHTIMLFDDDRVDTSNMSGQFFGRGEIGRYKVDAIRNVLYNYVSCNIYAISERYTERSEAFDIMICGFDNMEARKLYFNKWKNRTISLAESYRENCVFIDGRLSIDTLQVFCIKGTDTENMERYEKEFLFSDDEADETICSLKQTSYMAAMIGAMITNIFTNWVASSLDPIIPYDVPFFTEYDAQSMIFKTKY